MFSPIEAAKNIKEEFNDYLLTSFHIADPHYAEQFNTELNKEGAVSKGPFLDINDSYKKGVSLERLIEEGELSTLFRELEGDIPDQEKELQLERRLYLHQEEAIRKTNQGKNLIVTTGTGSGKTECFIIPIINWLLNEKEHSRLSPGVRAILIYPMNALANDQMKRLRRLLKNYPDITFGLYNSSTKYMQEEGVYEYSRIFKNENSHALDPLPNELLSREQMREAPPHILVTNYAMLEYMLLRPRDDAVFSGSQLRFLVLDEAHIYKGATGIETALLLKRLKARISDPDQVINIMTSATLGGKDADSEIVQFAETLCSAAFDKSMIIRSQSVSPLYETEDLCIPLRLFEELSRPNKSLNEILKAYGYSFPETKPDEEILYDICCGSDIYKKLRDIATHPMTLAEITSKMQQFYQITENDIVNVVNVAVQASKNNTPLIKARYHLFMKALEGAYITIGGSKKMMLTRKNSITENGVSYKVFACAICNDCGRIALVGRVKNDHLEFASDEHDLKLEYFLLRNKNEIFEIEDEDSGEIEVNQAVDKNDYLICAQCGALIHESQYDHSACSCGAENYVRVRKTKMMDSGNDKCPSCNQGRLRTVYIGSDAATAVLGTALFEELPETEMIVKRHANAKNTRSRFGRHHVNTDGIVERGKVKQFLVFSDSRNEAAYFASYMSSSYQEFLRRRGIWHVIEANQENMERFPWEIQQFVEELASYFDSNRTFSSPGDNGTENLTAISRKQAWIAVLNEMVNARRSTSLSSLGVLQFNYKQNTIDNLSGIAEEYGITFKDAKALFDLLVSDIVHFGAIESDINLSNAEREYIYYAIKPKRFVKIKDYSKHAKKNNLGGWMATIQKNGNYRMNGRLKRIMNVLKIGDKEANELLEAYWDEILQGDMVFDHDERYLKTEAFTISACSESTPIYVCDRCGRTTMMNCQDRCTTLKCQGHLRKTTHSDVIAGNHYAKLYRSSQMKPLHIKEHTAQLAREEKQRYQEMFINKQINALSCSTTFEMGVDVGDLETVYLRNMPPSPANYVQRAGRAGRGRNSAAFSLTYAKLSSHDFTFFKKPENMITGKIGVPHFTISNEKILQRHIFAVALSAFFADHPEVYNENNAEVLLCDDGWEKLNEYLREQPAILRQTLEKSIPEVMHQNMGISNYSWIERLIGPDGVLTVAVNEFRETVSFYVNEIEKLTAAGQIEKAGRMQRKLRAFRKSSDDKNGRNELIEFLVRNNVLPKYGFPVDTVELYENTRDYQKSRLQMVRDLQLAISDYAPDSQVVADGKLYTSRYIKKPPQKHGNEWNLSYLAYCRNCQTWNYRATEPEEDGSPCISCHETIEKDAWKSAIEPRRGFIAESNVKNVPLKKPEKKYRSDDFYVGDTQRRVIEKYLFETEMGDEFSLESSTNDSLMVVCNDDFYVCPRCGYAHSVSENKKQDAKANSYAKYIKKPHVTPWGSKCETRLERYKLCHVFKTDVVHLTFFTLEARNYRVMISVLYALLEGLSIALDIERTDIKGCLRKTEYKGQMIYSIVLYDAVAGGAGHVRRMVTKTGDVFQRVIAQAIEITKGCNCEPSCYNCLRNYYNQDLHDQLDRKAAYEFLEGYRGAINLVK